MQLSQRFTHWKNEMKQTCLDIVETLWSHPCRWRKEHQLQPIQMPIKHYIVFYKKIYLNKNTTAELQGVSMEEQAKEELTEKSWDQPLGYDKNRKPSWVTAKPKTITTPDRFRFKVTFEFYNYFIILCFLYVISTFWSAATRVLTWILLRIGGIS